MESYETIFILARLNICLVSLIQITKQIILLCHTVCYSIESYAYAKQNDVDEKLVNLINAMMKYGNAAYLYIN